jgi:hypothetical protein
MDWAWLPAFVTHAEWSKKRQGPSEVDLSASRSAENAMPLLVAGPTHPWSWASRKRASHAAAFRSQEGPVELFDRWVVYIAVPSGALERAGTTTELTHQGKMSNP